MKKVTCFITGGHQYASVDTIVTEDFKTEEVIFSNKCARCGEIKETRVPRELIYKAMFSFMRKGGGK